ncbi:MAG TPA: PEPxxWA-CTERM sorting domain-containing protein [Albitalea sp.]|nr:PEPxxWA-CTERM sorting domain-containing protein [Albitalea sp.]
MRTTTALWKTLVASVIAVSAQGASAAFLTSSSAFGANSLVTDTSSGLTWLNLNVTQGMSFNQVAAGLASDPLYADFRVATLAEVDGLFGDAGFYVNSGVIGDTNPTRLAAGASFAAAFTGVQQANGSEFFQGYLGVNMIPIDPIHDVFGMWKAGVAFNPASTTVAFAFDDTTGGYSTVGDPGTGTWLVAKGPVVTPVPEPATYALMLAGLAAVGAVVRRRRS